MPEKGFQKGRKKTGGRPKGSKGIKTKVANALVNRILESGWKEVDEIWNQLSPREKMEFMAKFMNFSIPQRARVESENKLPTSITVNMIAATPEKIQEQNVIDIGHEEIDN